MLPRDESRTARASSPRRHGQLECRGSRHAALRRLATAPRELAPAGQQRASRRTCGATVRGTYGTAEAGTRRRTYSAWRFKASCPAPLVRTARSRLIRVSLTYSTEAPGRTGQHREGPAAHEGREAGDEHEPAARQHVLQPLALAKRPVLGTDRRCRAANTRRRRPVVLLAAAWHVGVLHATCCVRGLVATGLETDERGATAG